MGRRANWGAASARMPEFSDPIVAWETFFDSRPDVMWQILGDIAKVYVATDDLTRRVGRRPGVHDMSLDDLDLIVTPRYSMDPITVSLPELIGNRSQRAFAARVPCHHSALQRIIDGRLIASRVRLEELARAGRVGPAYFVEWRAMFIADAMAEAYAKHPNLSITAYKKLVKENDVALSR